MPIKLTHSRLAALLSLLVCVGGSNAAEFGYEFRVGGAYSDNVHRVSTLAEDQTIAIAGIDIDASGESRRFEGSLLADVEYRDYLEDAFDDEVLPSIDAIATVKIAPELFHWVFEDKLGQLQRNPFLSDVADNRETLNSFSTGPDFFMRLGGRTSLELRGRYTVYTFEISNSDNDQANGTISLVRALSENRSISLNASADQVEFEDDVQNSNFDRRAAYLGFSSRISNGTLLINLGVNELDDGNTEFQGTLATVAWDRQFSGHSSVNLNYHLRFSDAGDFFNRYDAIGQGRSESDDIVPISDPFENQTFRLGYSYDQDTGQFFASLFLSEDEYQTETEFDSRRIGIRVGMTKELGSGWDVGLNVRAENRDFEISGRDDDYLDIRVNVGRQLTRIVSVTLEYARAERSSNDAGANYTENRYSLFLRFGPKN